MKPLTPKQRAVAVRFGKVTFFSFFGYALAAVSVIVTYVLTKWQLSGELVVVGGAVAGGVAAAIQKSVNWKAAGVDAPPATLGGPPA
jgi:hypothetical protein